MGHAAISEFHGFCPDKYRVNAEPLREDSEDVVCTPIVEWLCICELQARCVEHRTLIILIEECTPSDVR